MIWSRYMSMTVICSFLSYFDSPSWILQQYLLFSIVKNGGIRERERCSENHCQGRSQSFARFFCSEAGIQSGPLALWISKLESKAKNSIIGYINWWYIRKGITIKERNIRRVFLSENSCKIFIKDWCFINSASYSLKIWVIDRSCDCLGKNLPTLHLPVFQEIPFENSI